MTKEMKVARGTARANKRKGLKPSPTDKTKANPTKHEVQHARWASRITGMTLGMADRYMAQTGLIVLNKPRDTGPRVTK